MNKTILIITDGIGHNPNTSFNAFSKANKPNYDFLATVPKSLIPTFGLAVGLPKGQMGNSEVGHMTIGAGKVLYQDLVKISLSIEENKLEHKTELVNILKQNKRVHIIGLISDGGVHSHIKHIIYLSKVAEQNNKQVFLHLITDGRDVSPKSSLKYIREIKAICSKNIKIATISGRFWTMDRDNRWDRIEKSFQAISEATPKLNISIEDYVEKSYSQNIYDEFLEPIAIDDYNGMEKNDVCIFANFRSDRIREITEALGNDNFTHFKRENKNLNILTMTNYNDKFNYPILFKKEKVNNCLAEIISKAGLKQLHIAESEKYAHVTFFFNGGEEKPFKNEDRILIPSPNVKSYDEKPEMSAVEVGLATCKGMEDDYDFIVVNFANGDMVGHTGNFEAGVKAVESVDLELGKIIKKAEEKNYSLIITSDHGNCEKMRDEDGSILTNHTVGDVWCYFLSKEIKIAPKKLGLNDIASEVLKLLKI